MLLTTASRPFQVSRKFSELTLQLTFHPSAAWSLLSPCVELSISARFFLTNAFGWVIFVMCPSSFRLPAILFPRLEAIRFIFTSCSVCSIYSGVWNQGFNFCLLHASSSLKSLFCGVRFPKIHVELKLVCLNYTEPCVISAWPDPASTEAIEEVIGVNGLGSGNRGL